MRVLSVVAGLLVLGTGANGQSILVSPNPVGAGFFGDAVAGIGDINGDGKGDLIVGAPAETVGTFTSAGRVYLISGATGARLRTIISPHAKSGGVFGASVASVPDVNGDGVPDVVVGAPDEDTEFTLSGRAYIFSGATGSLLIQLISPGRELGGSFGFSVGGLMDVDGDGRGDVVIGAPSENPGTSPTGCGRAYIYSGRTGALWKKLLPPTPQSFGGFGTAVAGIPDTDGDGRGDVIVGAPRENPLSTPLNSGRAHIFSGATGARRVTIQSPGMMANGFFGSAVTGLADADGDGRGDVVVGAPQEHPGTSPDQCGRAYVYSGRTGHFWVRLLPPTPEVGGHFGAAVSGIPDTNADGFGDVIVGAPLEGGAVMHSGRTHIYSGASGVRLFTLFPPAPQADGRFGGAVAGLPDTGATFRGDMAVGASTETPTAQPVSAGRAYIYRR